MEKENNLLGMTRKEFEEYKKKSKYCNFPYEYYRMYPILNHKQQQELTIFARTNNDPIDIIKKCIKLLEKNK